MEQAIQSLAQRTWIYPLMTAPRRPQDLLLHLLMRPFQLLLHNFIVLISIKLFVLSRVQFLLFSIYDDCNGGYFICVGFFVGKVDCLPSHHHDLVQRICISMFSFFCKILYFLVYFLNLKSTSS